MGDLEGLDLEELEGAIAEILRGQFLQDLPCPGPGHTKDAQLIGGVADFNFISASDGCFFNPSVLKT